MSAFRTEKVYIQRRTIKRLWDAIKMYQLHEGAVGQTADAIADHLLNEVIQERYPEVLRLEKEKEKLEESFALSIRQEQPE